MTLLNFFSLSASQLCIFTIATTQGTTILDVDEKQTICDEILSFFSCCFSGNIEHTTNNGQMMASVNSRTHQGLYFSGGNKPMSSMFHSKPSKGSTVANTYGSTESGYISGTPKYGDNAQRNTMHY